MANRPTIVRDRREKQPLRTRGGYAVDFVDCSLAVGDYCLASDCSSADYDTVLSPHFAVEWKSRNDAITSILNRAHRQRETAKVMRARALGFVMPWVVGGGRDAILHYRHWGKIRRRDGSPVFRDAEAGYRAFARAIKQWRVKVGVPVLFASDKRDGARIVIGLCLGEEFCGVNTHRCMAVCEADRMAARVWLEGRNAEHEARAIASRAPCSCSQEV